MIQIDFELPDNCGECPLCIYTADEKRYVGYCNTSDEDYYCKVLQRFMEYDKVDGGLDILGKPTDCPLKEVPTGKLITTKQLEDMYKKYERKLWNEREDVRGDDMVEIGFAEQFLQDGLMELGCWDNDVVDEQQGEES